MPQYGINDTIVVMKEEKIPTNTELREALESIRQATNDEAMERINRGLTLEPEARYVPRDVHDAARVRPVEKKQGLDLKGYIEEWQRLNEFYLPNNIDLGETEIKNTSGVDIPFNFIDYLIGKAKILMIEKDLSTLNHIKEIKVRFRHEEKELVLLTKNDSEEIAILSFQTEPPFGLVKVESDLFML